MAEETQPLESTTDLIERARQGNTDALERLMAQHLGPLRQWVSGRLPRWARDLADTDDLVQDTLLRTLTRIKDFDARGAGAFHAYLRQAVMNRLRDELRRKGRLPVMVHESSIDVAADSSPLEEAIGREAFERYQAALGRLRREDREAILARVEMDYSYAEVAEILGKPTPEAARQTTRRALLRLAEEMAR